MYIIDNLENTDFGDIFYENKYSNYINSGFMLVKYGEFSKAFNFFDKLAENGIAESQIYWGLLLTTHQCRSNMELITSGVPITNDTYYKLAYDFGSAEEKKTYSEVAELILFKTQLRIYEYTVEKKDSYLAKKWIDHYERAVPDDTTFCELNKIMLKYCRSKEYQPLFCGMLADFLFCYERLLDEFLKTCKTSMLLKVADAMMQSADNAIKKCFKTAMDELYEKITAPVSKTDGPVLFRNTEKYSEYVNEFRASLEKSGLKSFSSNRLDNNKQKYTPSQIWADPYGVYTQETGRTVTMINMDNNGITASARWLSLAEKVWNETHEYTVSAYSKIEAFYENAHNACADKESICASRDKMLNDIINRKEVIAQDILYVLKFRERDENLYWRYLIAATDNFTFSLSEDYFAIGNKAYAFEKKPFKKMSLIELEQAISHLKLNLNNLTKVEKTHKEALSPFFDKLISIDSKNAGEYRKKWQNYLKSVEKVCNEAYQKISTDLCVAEKQYKISHKITDIIFKVISVIKTLLFLPLASGMYQIFLMAKSCFESPESMLQYNWFRFILIAISGCILLGLLSFVLMTLISRICNSIEDKIDPTISKKCRKTSLVFGVFTLNRRANKRKLSGRMFSEPLVFGIINTLFPVLILCITSVSVVLFAYSTITFTERIGTISISSVDELEYISNHPKANFVLQSNIECGGQELYFGNFYGELDGQGYTISNITPSKDSVFSNNSGVIKNINFSDFDITSDFSLLGKNNGSVQNVTFSNIVLSGENTDFSGIADRNSGEIVSCKVQNITGDGHTFVGFVDFTTGNVFDCIVSDVNVNISGSAYGFSSNIGSGTVTYSSFSGELNCGAVAAGFAGNVHSNAVLEKCWAEGVISGGQRLSGFIDKIGNAQIQNCYSTMNVTQICTRYNNTLSGLIGGFSPSKNATTATVKNCYFGGTLTSLKGEEGYYYSTSYGGLLGSISQSSYDNCSIIFDSCFCSASYSVSVGDSYRSSDSLVVVNTYASEEHAFSKSKLVEKKSKSEILNTSFIQETLGWDQTTWNIVDGNYPALLND